MIFRILLSFSLLLFLISCNKDDPKPGFSKITLIGVNLQKPVSGTRILASEVWNHPLPATQQITFTSQETGELYPFQIPGDLEKNPFVFELPVGSYSYKSSNSSSKISTTLPIDLEGTLIVNSTELSTRLEGVSRFQLLSFQKTNLKQPPILLLPENATMTTLGNFYYVYTQGLTKTEILLANGNSFRLGIDPMAFVHSSFFYPKSSSPESPIGLSDPVFEITSQSIPLSNDQFPEYFPPYKRQELMGFMGETSGLEDIDGRLFTMNDGGNLPELFEIDPETGGSQRLIRIENATNIDWEDLASNDTHFFVGDFGNNLGNRKDLRILKIPILDVFTKSPVQAEILEFTYPDQSSFDDPNHRFDCEAMVFWNGKLHLFTKPVNGNETTQYTLDPNLKSQVATKLNTFSTPGKITGADITSDGKNLVLIGYEISGITSRSFVQVFSNLTPGQISPNSTRNTIYLGNISQTSQTEGIAIQSLEKIKISGEKITVNGLTLPPRFFEIDLKGVLSN